jgi:hypothetical protein
VAVEALVELQVPQSKDKLFLPKDQFSRRSLPPLLPLQRNQQLQVALVE